MWRELEGKPVRYFLEREGRRKVETIWGEKNEKQKFTVERLGASLRLTISNLEQRNFNAM